MTISKAFFSLTRTKPCAVIEVSESSKINGGEICSFFVRVNDDLNLFYRSNLTAVQGHFRNGEHSRILFNFVEGHTGVLLQFNPHTPSQRIEVKDNLLCPYKDGNGVHGVYADLQLADTATLQRQNIMFGTRPIREKLEAKRDHPKIEFSWYLNGTTLVIERLHFDRVTKTVAKLVPDENTIITLDEQCLTIRSEVNQPSFRLYVGTSAQLAQPIPAEEIFNSPGSEEYQDDRLVFTFLSYTDQLAAGSWRFLQGAFGRDTLFSLWLVMDKVKNSFIESALSTIIERFAREGNLPLSGNPRPAGFVSHEDSGWDWGDYLHLVRNKPENIGKKMYDYRMVDSSFIPCIVLASYASRISPSDFNRFLQQKTSSRTEFREEILANIKLGMDAAKAFGSSTEKKDLIHFEEGELIGEWRDSTVGNGFGKVSYGVNCALVPAHLRACATLLSMDEFGGDLTRANQAQELADVWLQYAHQFFQCNYGAAEVEQVVEQYCEGLGIKPVVDLPANIASEGIEFMALSLDDALEAIPVMQSDEAFLLNFLPLSEPQIRRIINTLFLPFPYGLMMENVGVVVANPAFAKPEIQEIFTHRSYHGTVVWSWHHVMIARGLKIQRERQELSNQIKNEILAAEIKIWHLIDATRAMRFAELWSWQFLPNPQTGQGYYEMIPYASGRGTESNVLQLWSATYFGLDRPQY